MAKKKTKFQIGANPYEKLTASIYSQLSPNFNVTHDDKIVGEVSNRSRQIDVSVKGKVDSEDFLMIVQCKNQGRPVNITQIESFVTMLKDVKANKGIIVSNSGFSKSVFSTAKYYGIELCSIHETLNKDWTLELNIPVVWDILEAEVQMNGDIELKRNPQLPNKNFELNLDKNDIFKEFKKAWDSGRLNEHTKEYMLFNHNLDDPKWEIMGDLCSIKDQMLRYKVVHKFYLGYLEKLPSVRGIKNELRNIFEFSMDLNDFKNFDKSTMLQIKDPDQIALDIKNVIKVKLEPSAAQQSN